MSFQNVIIAAHPELAEAEDLANKIVLFFKNHGVSAFHGMLYDDNLRNRVKEKKSDLLIALGGDGTMLRAGHLCAPYGVPILGINLGRIGFLMEISKDHWQESLPKLLSGEFWIESRMMLSSKQWREDNLLGQWDVLNEVVVCRGKVVRPMYIDAHVDGSFLTTFVADGLIASTPTGSTAYALAAGGPILPPDLRNILVVPIAPHFSFDRAIVLAEGSSVSITVHTDHEAVMSVDGQVPITLLDGDRVDVKAGDHSVKFVRIQDRGYFYRNLTPHMVQNHSRGSVPFKYRKNN